MQHSVIAVSEPYGLGLDQKVMPEYFKELGYDTHMVGKVCLLGQPALRKLLEIHSKFVKSYCGVCKIGLTPSVPQVLSQMWYLGVCRIQNAVECSQLAAKSGIN